MENSEQAVADEQKENKEETKNEEQKEEYVEKNNAIEQSNQEEEKKQNEIINENLEQKEDNKEEDKKEIIQEKKDEGTIVKEEENKNIEEKAEKEENNGDIKNPEQIKQENNEENALNEINTEKKDNENDEKKIIDKEEDKPLEQDEEEKEKDSNQDRKDNQDNKNEVKDNITIKRNLGDSEEYDRSIKVIVLGDSSVGKSCFINRLKEKEIHEIQSTVGIEHYTYIISLNTYTIRMQIWDTAGQEKFNSIINNYYKGTEVGIFLYSIDNENTFNNVMNWYNNLKEKNNENTINILIGNKKDLENENRKVTYEQGEDFAEENKFLLFREITCKSNDKNELENIMEIFDEIGKYYYNYYKNRRNISATSVDMNYMASKTMIEIGEQQRKTVNKKTCC